MGEMNQSAQSTKAASSAEKVRDPQTYEIIGAAMEVHSLLGCGFHEPVYQEALAKGFTHRGIPYRREIELAILYKGEALDVTYKPDFICYDSVIVELKALDKISGKEQSQVINYLKATGIERALLFNFGTIHLEYHRLILGFKHQWKDNSDRA
jgi:GxxExxY protein